MVDMPVRKKRCDRQVGNLPNNGSEPGHATPRIQKGGTARAANKIHGYAKRIDNAIHPGTHTNHRITHRKSPSHGNQAHHVPRRNEHKAPEMHIRKSGTTTHL